VTAARTRFKITVESPPDTHGRQQYTLEWPRDPPRLEGFPGREVLSTRRAQVQRGVVDEVVKRFEANGHSVEIVHYAGGRQ
jgi:hypothetical protein